MILSAAGTAAVCQLGWVGEQPESAQPDCAAVHIPYSEASLPFPVRPARCGLCGRAAVPDLLLATTEPVGGALRGRPGLVQARVSRAKRDLRGEAHAREVSDALPFLEYELHRQLVAKLRVAGMNAVFGLQVTYHMFQIKCPSDWTPFAKPHGLLQQMESSLMDKFYIYD